MVRKTNIKIIILISLISIIVLNLISTSVLAVNPDSYTPNQQINSPKFLERAGIVLGWIKYLGILIAVIVLTIIGLKYLFGSVEGKAEYKKSMVPYVLGCFLLMGVSLVIALIESVAKA